MKSNSALFYICSLIEYLGRSTNNSRADILKYLGEADVERIYKYADIFHCETIEKVADDFIEKDKIPTGAFDNVSANRFAVPDVWEIGAVFQRLIEDCYLENRQVEGIYEVYESWIADKILNFNTDFYYQSREYLAMCYKEGKVLE